MILYQESSINIIIIIIIIGFWEWEMSNIASCNGGSYNVTSGQFIPPSLNAIGNQLYMDVSSYIFNCTFASVIGLLLAAVYYTLRPKNPQVFLQWWPRGKFSLILILIFTSVAIICLLGIFGMSVSLLLSSTQYSCHANPGIFYVDMTNDITNFYTIDIMKIDRGWKATLAAILVISGVLLF